MKIEKASKRIRTLFEKAAQVAEDSKFETFKHGAILYKSGRIINTACNKKRPTAFGKRFDTFKGECGLHAEIGAVLGISARHTQGADVFVVRYQNDETKMSHPCHMCTSVLKYCGVKRIYYTTGPRTFDVLNISRERVTFSFRALIGTKEGRVSLGQSEFSSFKLASLHLNKLARKLSGSIESVVFYKHTKGRAPCLYKRIKNG